MTPSSENGFFLFQVAKLDKASFLAELRGMSSNKKKGAPLPAGTGPATAAPSQQPYAEAGASGWGVLSDTFGLQGIAACAISQRACQV